MKRVEQFWGEEAGSAEAASVALMIGALSAALTGLWDTVADNAAPVIVAVVGGIFLFWLLFKK